MLSTEPLSQELTIEGLTEPIILSYFNSLNSGQFKDTAALFAESGTMCPPFEPEIVGPDAIAEYLQREAIGIKTSPHQGILKPLQQEQIEVQVTGTVQTSWCGVNVNWLFILNQQKQIIYVKVKLLASPQELLSLKRS